jgi:hypothetical protein
MIAVAAPVATSCPLTTVTLSILGRSVIEFVGFGGFGFACAPGMAIARNMARIIRRRLERRIVVRSRDFFDASEDMGDS